MARFEVISPAHHDPRIIDAAVVQTGEVGLWLYADDRGEELAALYAHGQWSAVRKLPDETA